MINIYINPKDLRRINKRLNKHKSYAKVNFPNEIKRTLADATQMAKRTAPIDTGNLRKSIGYDFQGSKTAIFQALANYASFVEFGTRFQGSQPYFFPSLYKALSNLDQRIKKQLRRL